MGVDEIVNRMLGAVIVIGASIAVVPMLLGMLNNETGIDPMAGILVFVAIVVMFIAGFIYIVREKKYS